MIKKTKNFFLEVRTEMGKVTWPTRPELFESTGVVLMCMFLLSAFIGITDFILSHVLSLVLR